VISLLVRLGLLPHTYPLEVEGARTGQLRTMPVTLVENGERWLVAPYGDTGARCEEPVRTSTWAPRPGSRTSGEWLPPIQSSA